MLTNEICVTFAKIPVRPPKMGQYEPEQQQKIFKIRFIYFDLLKRKESLELILSI